MPYPLRPPVVSGNNLTRLGIALFLLGLALALIAGCAVQPALRPADVSGTSEQVGEEQSYPPAGAYQHFFYAKQLQYEKRYLEAVDQMRLALAFDNGSARLHYELGMLLLASGQVQTSIASLKQAQQLDERFIEPVLILGQIALAENRFQDAAAYFDRVIELDPVNDDAIRHRAELVFMEQGIEGMTRFLENILKRSPTHFESLSVLTKLYQQQQEYVKLEQTLIRLLELDPENLVAIEQLSTWYSRTRRFDQAIKLFQRLENLLPPNSLIPLKIGQFYLQGGDLQQARKHFDEAESLDETGERIRFSIGLAYAEAGRFVLAAKQFQSLAVEFGDAGARYFWGWSLVQAKQYAKALSAFSPISRHNSRYYALSQAEMARCQWELAHKAKADELAEHLIETMTDDVETYRSLANYFRDTGRMQKSLETLQLGLQRLPQNPELLYLLAMMLEEDHQQDRALETMQTLLSIQPDHANALNFVGYSLAQRGERLDEAEAMVRKALQQKPGEGYIIDSLGWVYYHRGDLEQAETWLLLAAMIEPFEAEILFHLALVLRDQGNREEKLRQVLEQAAALEIRPAALLDEFTAAFPDLWPMLRLRLAPPEKQP